MPKSPWMTTCNKKILVVDDEPELRELMVEEIADHGFECIGAESGQEALDLLAKHSIFLVVSDINMPEMNGIQLLEKIQNIELGKPRVILITGYCGYDEEELLKKGASHVFYKPFEFSHLMEVLEKVRDAA